MSCHKGNEELLSLLENLRSARGILYIQEGVIPQCQYNVAMNASMGRIRFENLIAVSGIITNDGVATNHFVTIEQSQWIIPGIESGQYVPLYIDVSNNTIAMDTPINYEPPNLDPSNGGCTNVKDYIYYNYPGGVPWDATGNMPITKADDPNKKIYIGYLCATSQTRGDGEVSAYLEFLPQYASTGVSDVDTLILPPYYKYCDSLGSDFVMFKYIKCTDNSRKTLEDFIPNDNNTLFLLDRHEYDVPRSITFTEVLVTPQIVGSTGVSDEANFCNFGQIVRTHDRKLVYNGNPASHLAPHDIIYPYYLEFDFDNKVWGVKHYDSDIVGKSAYINNSLSLSDSTPDANIFFNYIIMTIEWGGDNVALMPAKPAQD